MDLDDFQTVSFITGPGVYALFLKGELRYIGQSRKLCDRLTQHVNNWARFRQGKDRWGGGKPIKFDEVRVFPCKLTQLNNLEKELIHKYLPPRNVRTHGDVPRRDLAPIINVVMAKCQGEDLRGQEGSRQFANSLRRM